MRSRTLIAPASPSTLLLQRFVAKVPTVDSGYTSTGFEALAIEAGREIAEENVAMRRKLAPLRAFIGALDAILAAGSRRHARFDARAAARGIGSRAGRSRRAALPVSGGASADGVDRVRHQWRSVLRARRTHRRRRRRCMRALPRACDARGRERKLRAWRGHDLRQRTRAAQQCVATRTRADRTSSRDIAETPSLVRRI
jgi:hypothetical protein